jgi:hypothetical protein
MGNPNVPSRPQSKRAAIVAGAIALIVLLAVAAFVGGQLLQQDARSKAIVSRPPQKLVTPAAGLPVGQPDVRGDVQATGDSSFMVCTPNPDRSLSVNSDGSVNDKSSCGAQIEVVTGRDTIFYHDVTSQYYPGTPVPNQDLVLQERVEPGSAQAIAVNTTLVAWGTRNGNRLQAKTIVYWVRPARQ